MIYMPKYGLNQCRCPVRMLALNPCICQCIPETNYAKDYIPRFFALMIHEI